MTHTDLCKKWSGLIYVTGKAWCKVPLTSRLWSMSSDHFSLSLAWIYLVSLSGKNLSMRRYLKFWVCIPLTMTVERQLFLSQGFCKEIRRTGLIELAFVTRPVINWLLWQEICTCLLPGLGHIPVLAGCTSNSCKHPHGLTVREVWH